MIQAQFQEILRLSPPPTSEDAARLVDAAVLFFDLRGFSRWAEEGNRRLLEVQLGIRRVMSAMSEEVYAERGRVLHFVGDGLIACWNAPESVDKPAARACRAALMMEERLRAMAEWRCGISVTYGEVVAGWMGSDRDPVYSVMGAVVNQASRVEGITKALGTTLLVTRDVASRLEPSTVMRVGKFRPYGMREVLDLFEVHRVPPPPERVAAFAKGLAALENGDFELATSVFTPLARNDGPARFLATLSGRYCRLTPWGWAGVIEMEGK